VRHFELAEYCRGKYPEGNVERIPADVWMNMACVVVVLKSWLVGCSESDEVLSSLPFWGGC
jgi:hypothetical protein